MNEIAKQSISNRLRIALSKESLTKVKAGELLQINSNYLSMVDKPDQWKKFPETSWDVLQKWANSGQGIVEYYEKHGKVLPEKKEIPEPRVTVKPEALEKRKKELAETDSKRLTNGQLIDLLIKERDLLKEKIAAIDILLKHYIS